MVPTTGGADFDTALESYTLNTTYPKRDLASLTLAHLHLHIPSYEDIAGKGTKRLQMNQVRGWVPYELPAAWTTLNPLGFCEL